MEEAWELAVVSGKSGDRWSGKHTRLRYQTVVLSFLYFTGAILGVEELNLPSFVTLKENYSEKTLLILMFIVALSTLISFVFQTVIERGKFQLDIDDLELRANKALMAFDLLSGAERENRKIVVGRKLDEEKLFNGDDIGEIKSRLIHEINLLQASRGSTAEGVVFSKRELEFLKFDVSYLGARCFEPLSRALHSAKALVGEVDRRNANFAKYAEIVEDFTEVSDLKFLVSTINSSALTELSIIRKVREEISKLVLALPKEKKILTIDDWLSAYIPTICSAGLIILAIIAGVRL